MFNSEAERILRAANEKSGAQFTEEQIRVLSISITKIAAQIVEEAFASLRSSSGNKPSFFS
jgi:hypothetical protein